MRVVGALCWFHEPPEFLEALVRSLPGVIDELVALDGPWDHFPHRSLQSPDEQQAALRDTAADVGIPLTMLGGDTLWASQVAKRAFLYETAAERGDWMFIADGDEELMLGTGVHELLDSATEDVGSVYIKRVSEGRRVLERMARRLFRTRYGLSVMETHNGIVTDDGRWLAGPRRIAKEPRFDASRHIRILHRQMSRGDRRNNWSQRYYQVRARHRIEVH